MKIKSTRFDALDIPEEYILSFPKGLPGFPEERKFAYFPFQPDSPFGFLQSVSDPDLTFMIVEPFYFFVDYNFEIDDIVANEFGFSSENPPQIFNILTVLDKFETATVNLVAPVIVNWRNRKALQIVLDRTNYTTRDKLFPNGLPKPAQMGGD